MKDIRSSFLLNLGATALLLATAAPALAMMAVNWSTPSGLARLDGTSPLLSGGPALAQLIYCMDGVADPADVDGSTTGDDVVLDEVELMASEVGAAGQHFSAVYTNSFMPGFVFIRIFDTGTAMLSVPPGTAYFDGPILALVDSSLPMTYQDLTEGAFAQGTASDSSGRYVLDKVIPGGGGAVSVAFTNADESVDFAVSNLVVGGVAANASGYLRWTNLLNGANDTLPAASSWSFMAPLALGSNLISVVASNASGDSTSDLLVIFRAAPAPVLDITNQNATVGYATSNLMVGGVSPNLIGSIAWTNQLNGAAGSFPVAASWSFNSPLAVGTNVITVAGFGGSIAVTTQAVDRGADMVYSNGWETSDNGGSGFGPWNLTTTVGDPNRNGHFTATDPLYTSIGVPAWGLYANLNNLASAYRLLLTPLATNQVLAVQYENGLIDGAGSCGIELLNASYDSLFTFYINGGDSFYRLGTDLTDVAMTTNGIGLEIRLTGPTNYSLTVAPQGAATRVYQGSLTPQANSQITIFRVWNYTAGETSIRDVFVNHLQIRTETVQAGSPVSDTVTVIRAPAPVLDVTNTAVTVRYSVSTYTLGGVIGNGVTGQLRWTNSLIGASGSVVAASPFSIAGIALNVGANVIAVQGTNLYGDAASDSVTITRGELGTDLPVLDITNVNETVGNAVSNRSVAGTANLHVVGSITWSNSLGGSGSFAAAANWSFNAPLAVGANTITVRGSNLWSEVATDVVVITRTAAATPFVDITNTAARVGNAVSNLTVGGISSNLSGQIRWTNLLNGANGSLAVAGLWSFFTPLAEGSNILVVTGTNGAGQSASDSITIFRSNLVVGGTVTINWIGFVGFVREDGLTPLLSGAPKATYVQLLDAGPNGVIDQVDPCNPNGWVSGDDQVLDTTLITNPDDMDLMLQYAMGDYGIYSGPATGPVLCFGRIFKDPEPGPGDFYYNSLPQWIALDDPFNPTPSVYDLNTGDFDPAVVNLPVPPCGGGVSVDITNMPATVGYATSNLTIGGVASNATGFIRWTNSLNGVQGTVAAASTWAFTTPLGVGTNLLTVVATNGTGASASDVLQVIRAPAPVLDVTNTAVTVRYSVSTYTLGGVIDNGVTGQLRWTNILTGASGTIAAASPFSIAGIALNVGANVITVQGTNLYGDAASDSVTITRGGLGTDLPVLDVTTPNQTVGNAVSNLVISGTANVHVAGQISWFNMLSGPGGSFAAGTNWLFMASLAVGTNTIIVSGSNLWSETTIDVVTIIRGPSASAGPVLDITNVNQVVAQAVSNLVVGGISSNLVGQIRWTNSLNGANGTLAAASSWSFLTPLAVGMNALTMRGTNLLGDAATDVLYVMRSSDDVPSGMVLIPAGSFVMGNVFTSDYSASASELPTHTVNVSAVYMDVFEVTKALWDEVKAFNGGNGYAYSNAGLGKAPNHPVHSVSWFDVVKWCNARSEREGLTPCYSSSGVVYRTGIDSNVVCDWSANGYRLPTNAEWEKAARGGAANTRFPWTDYTNNISHAKANYEGHTFFDTYELSDGYHPAYANAPLPYTSPVGSFAPNGYGLYDMAGNVWEACWDFYDDTYYASSPASDPRGPTGPLSRRVRRGGAWDYFAFSARVSFRSSVEPGYVEESLGFRCARGMGTGAPGSPLIDITNVDQTVSYAVSNLVVGGTSSNLVGEIHWTNQLNGAGGTLAAATTWSFMSPIGLGTNPIVVRGSNLVGQVAADTVVVTRTAAALPLVDITNASETVGFAVTSRGLGGLASNVVGVLTWTNQAGQVGGTIPAAALWSIPGISLAVGANSIVVQGSNGAGNVASDTVTLTRVAAPVLDITNVNAGVRYSTTNWSIGGVSSGLVGQLRWTNALTGGSGTVAAGSPFAIGGIALAVGSNLITVAGTNLYGDAASDSMYINRGGLGTDLPVLDITNVNATVGHAVSSLAVGGTANLHVVGSITWSNSLGGAGSLAASTNWSFNAPLAVGTNVITVRGTNLLGEFITDAVTLIRLPPPPMVTFYDLEADFRADANVDGQPWTYRYQAGSLARDGNYELLPSFTNNYLGGIEGLSGWNKGEIVPIAGCNLTGQPLTNSAFRIEPGHSDVHPSSTELVVVSWLAPTTDVVRLEYLFADYDAGGGDGVRWYVAYESTDIDSGILANGATTTVRTLGPFAVNAGDRLHFIVDPGPGGYAFDSTRIMARIRIGANPSRLDITTPDLAVVNSTASLLVEGTSSNLVGQITWTNTLGGSGALAASAAWSFNAALAVGTNLITVRGSNLWQETLTDTLTVIREASVGPGQGGNVWTNLGSGISGLAGRCWDIGFTTNQQILITGDFSSPAQHVALWNGSAWISVGHLGDVSDCVVRDPQGRMVVGGSFVTAGGVSANRIARWNGSSWTNLGAGLNGAPQDLVVMPDQSLIAAGQFTTAGGQPASNVARWTGAAWTNLGAGCGGVVRTLAQDGAGNLYAGGDFTNAGGVAARYVARWNGTAWSNLGSGMNNSVYELICDGAGNLYAGGAFTNAGGIAARYVAKWNGTTWTNLGAGLSSWVQGMAVDGAGNLYVGGNFTNAGGVTANRVAKWNGTAWTNMGAGMNHDVYTLAIDAQGYLHAGGQFTTADGITARAIARWNNPLSMNPPPYWTSTPVNLATVGKRYTYRLSAVDPQQEPLTFQGVNLPGWLSLVTGSGEVLGSSVISTVAGDGNYGFTGDGGPATSTRLAWPHSVIVDGAGRLYISDHENQRIRRVDTNGIITTVAGSGSTAYNGDGMVATNASLYYPIGLALDAVGRLYIADSYHYRVRRVELDGTITTVAGTGVSGFSGDGGPATNAQLSSTGDVALDAAGNLYIADMLNSRIRVVNPAGIIRTIAGTGSWGFGGDGQPATNAILNRPIGVSVDRNGLIYIADHYNHRVRRIALDGTITTVAGTGAGGYNGDGLAATAASLRYPYDVTVDDAGNLYIADDENNRVRKVGTNGVISTLAGRGVYAFGGDGGAATNARVAYPTDVELDAAGNLYICDAGNQRIRKIAGEAGGLRLTGIPGPGDVGSITITLQVSDGINVVPQVFTLGVGQLLAPTNLQAVAAGLSRVDLTWTDNNAGETGYVLERRTSTASVWAVIANLPANSSNFADTGLGSGQTYSYRIMAVNPDGLSLPSSVATATTLAVPNAPSGLSVVTVTTNRVALTWLDNASNEDGYEIQRRIGAVGAWLSIGSTGAGGASWTDLGVLPNTFYAYRVRATNAAGASAFSAEVSATTPPAVDDPDCGHGLLVTATNLLWDGAAQASPVTVPEATVVGGTLTCQQSSPRGAGAIHRVAMGFRNLDGFTMSPPREISLLYGTPGCPGRTVAGVTLPPDLRVPTNAGVYQLWIEAFVSPLDPRGLFSSQVRTAQTALARSLATVTVQPRPVGQIEARLLAADALLGQRVTVPMLLSSTGGESIISFSVDYPVARLASPWATAGADAPALWVVLNTGTPGRVGGLLLMPDDEALGAGTKRVLDLSFTAIATGVSSLVFADSPVARDVALVDPGVTPSVTWVGSTVQVRPAGFEGDLAPRPGGDLAVTEADRLLLQLMVSGLDAPANSNEFQKADCAPRGASGDGRINASDLRQIYRYAQGLDPLQPAAGPWSPVAPPPGLLGLHAEEDRAVTLDDVTTNRGDVVRLPVWLEAQGNESVLTFSLAYDAQLLTFLDMQLVGPATNAIAAPALQNSGQGEVGLALALPNSQVMPAGLQQVAEVYFASAAGAQSATTIVSFTDLPMPSGVAGLEANALVADFTDQASVVLLAEVQPGAPSAPSALLAEGVATNQVNLDWMDSSANETGFRVLRRAGTEAWTEIAVLSADQESYADIGLPSDTAFSYLIAAFNSSGTNLSAEVMARTWSGMDAWRQDQFGSPDDAGPAADGADWDTDGLPNYLEYALGLDPRFDHFPLTPFVARMRDGVVIGTNRFLTVEYDVGPGAGPAAVIRMQIDTNLMGSWATDMVPVDSMPVNGSTRYRVRSDQPLGARPREFLRMQVEPPTP